MSRLRTNRTSDPADRASQGRSGDVLLGVIVACFLVVSLPVVLRGAPLADDFNNCLAPQERGLGGFAAESWDRLGAIRLARFAEITVTTGVCRSLPFAVAIAVPLVLTIAVAWLVRGLLRDFGAPDPWPGVAAAAWLLQPVGTESALWPAALHVPLGLAFALGSLRLHRAGRHTWACLCVIGALASVEQMVLVLPVAAWLVTPAPRRRVAVLTTAAVVVGALVAFVIWPGNDPRLSPTISDRIAGAFEDPSFYVQFAAVGLGVHSIPLAVKWSVPVGLAVIGVGAFLGYRLLGPALVGRNDGESSLLGTVGWFALLVGLANVPVAFNVPHQGSPRIFAPTWLIVAIAFGVVGNRLVRDRGRLVGGVLGVLAAGALLSLSLSAWVRVKNADAVEDASLVIAERTSDGDRVALCGVRRAVVDGAPRGAFATHEFIYDWASADAVLYYTGRDVVFEIAGELWDRPCPSETAVDEVFSFPEVIGQGS